MISIVASAELWPTPEVVSSVVGVIATSEEEIGVRASVAGHIASHIEDVAARVCRKAERAVRIYQPVAGEGRASVYERDYRLAEQSSKVFAWVAPGEEMEGGTGHVVKAAMDRGVAVEAYRLDEDGKVVLLGSIEEGPVDH
jgi:hypothetical protein